MIVKECLCCGNEFNVKNYRKETAKFCSKNCNARFNYDRSLRNVDQSYKVGNKWRKGLEPNNAFEVGHIPWNKGTNGVMKSNRTSYKKGRKSERAVEIGYVSIRKDNNGAMRRHIKVGYNSWVLYAVWLFETFKGEIPKGMVVHHKDGNSLNDELPNLMLLTRKEHINIHRKQLQNGLTLHKID